MKKLSRKRKRLLIISGGVLLLLVLVILTVRGMHHLMSPRVDTEQGIQYIKAAESEDTAIIEQKIAQLESQDSQEGDTRSNKEKFTGSVVMGDSITEGFMEYDVLNASSVVSKIGVHLTELDDQIQRAKELNPQIIFLSYGMNDVTATEGDTDMFRKEYEAVVKQIQEEIPDAHIFVNSVFPVQEKALTEEPELADIASYNEVLKTMCSDLQIGYIDNTEIVEEQYYKEDGFHVKAGFYPVWGGRVTERGG